MAHAQWAAIADLRRSEENHAYGEPSKMIPDGGAAASGRSATMQDVARAARVSPMTVSNAFRHPHRVQEPTRLRVLTAAAELGYVPNLTAGHLAAGRSRVIGATVPSVSNSSFHRYLTGLHEGCSEHGHQLVLMLADTAAQERQAVEAFIGLRVAGMVLIGNDHAAATQALLAKWSIPLVETWLLDEAIDMAVGFRIDEAVRAACRLHLRAGRRRIGLIGNDPGTRRIRERLPVFRDEMRRAGLRDDLVVAAGDPHSFASGPPSLDALLALDADLDAVICPTDVVAASIVFECARRGISVPGRMGVVGWGDYEIAATMTPALTTIRPNPREMGLEAVAMLMERHATGRGPGRIDTGFELIERHSA